MSIDAQAMLTILKAAAEPTRLRILRLLAGSELNVKDLTRILGQSQPRISRHLKLLTEAGLVERYREGSWVYFHLCEQGPPARLIRAVLSELEAGDAKLVRDGERVAALKLERAAIAQRFFETNAARWDQIRSHHVAEAEVEAAISALLPREPVDLLVDLGTGTGRVLELLADRYRRAIGFDVSQAMLSYARANLEAAHIQHAQVRQGDVFNVPLGDGMAGIVVMHQVLHFLGDPAAAIREAARLAAPGGHVLLVDFAPHDLEFLREDFAHQRLGFTTEQVTLWLGEAGLEPARHVALPPPEDGGSDKLTVSLWLARAPKTAASDRLKSPKPLELTR